jgi:hypothetical protein
MRRDRKRLRNVAVIGMSVSQILDLTITKSVEAVIALTKVSLSILPLAVCDASKGKDEDTDLANEIDRVTGMVFGGIFSNIGPEKG